MKFIGTVLIVLGIGWLVLSGLCTLMFTPAIFSPEGNMLKTASSILMIGVPSMLFGWLMWRGGRWLVRRSDGESGPEGGR